MRLVQSTDISGCIYTKVMPGQTNNYYSLKLCSDLKTKDMVNKLCSWNLPKVEFLFCFFHIFACFLPNYQHVLASSACLVLALAHFSPLWASLIYHRSRKYIQGKKKSLCEFDCFYELGFLPERSGEQQTHREDKNIHSIRKERWGKRGEKWENEEGKRRTFCLQIQLATASAQEPVSHPLAQTLLVSPRPRLADSAHCFKGLPWTGLWHPNASKLS